MNAKSDLQRLKLAINNASGDEPEEDLETPLAARTESRDDGVFYIGTRVDPTDGKVTELPPLWLCDKIDILGRGIDESGLHYRVMRWKSRGNRQDITYAMCLGDVGERTGWSSLRTRGLAMAVGRKSLEHLANWLQTGGEDLMHAVSHRGGWNFGAYVLPSGEVIGTPTKPLFYNGDTSHAHAYRAFGTVEGWRDGVARLCSGNSRPMLAIGAALAAPLLHLVGLESGGFHLFGPSGCGKTTSANVGA